MCHPVDLASKFYPVLGSPRPLGCPIGRWKRREVAWSVGMEQRQIPARVAGQSELGARQEPLQLRILVLQRL
jgi:hypothetical protein